MNIDGWVCIGIFVVEAIAVGWIAYNAGQESAWRYFRDKISEDEDER